MIFKPAHQVILLFLLVLLGACQKEVPTRDIEAEIQSMMEDYGLPALSVAVVNDKSIMWERSYGYADVGNQVAASSSSVYHMASISKLMVATAAMQLEEQGMVDLDTDINFYLPVPIRNPYFPETPITLRMLMTHTAGIAWPQTYIEAKELWEHFPPDEAPRPSEWVPQFLVPQGVFYNSRIWKNTQPGTFELYSNIGTNVIAYVVEQISGKDFRDYCREFIFLPLGMGNSSYNMADLDAEKLVTLYRGNGLSIPFFDDRLAASGGLKMTIEDLCIFMMACINGGSYEGIKILEKTTLEKMIEIQNSVSGTCLLWHAGVGGWYGHTGGMEGAATATDMQYNEKVGMILFTNKHINVVYPGHELYGLVRQQTNTFR